MKKRGASRSAVSKKYYVADINLDFFLSIHTETNSVKTMTTIICITILAYCILGKDIKGLMEKIGDVDCLIYQQT